MNVWTFNRSQKKTHPHRAFRLYKTFGFNHGQSQKHGTVCACNCNQFAAPATATSSRASYPVQRNAPRESNQLAAPATATSSRASHPVQRSAPRECNCCFILVRSRSVCCLFHPFSAVATTHLLDGGAVAFEIVSFKRLETATRIKNLENADSGTEARND